MHGGLTAAYLAAPLPCPLNGPIQPAPDCHYNYQRKVCSYSPPAHGESTKVGMDLRFGKARSPGLTNMLPSMRRLGTA